jgi:AcrR family transcriptional regulator
MQIINDNNKIWIETGYKIVAIFGFEGLKIEQLAKKVGISKSSFYHHFADLELFVECLLKYHSQQAYIIAEKEKNAKNINPELINILIEHTTDLLFNRQLRVHRQQKTFFDTLIKTNQIIGNDFVLIWKKDLNLNLTQTQLEAFFELALENFYLQITPENLNKEWLLEYFNYLKKIISNFA